MKKSLVILITFVLLSGYGIYKANAIIGDEIDNVKFQEKVVYGDISAVEDVVISREVKYEDNLFWETTYDLGQVPMVDTTFTFSEFGKESWTWSGGYAGLRFEMSHTDAIMYHEEYDKGATDSESLSKVVYELTESAPAGKITTKTIKLKDYQPYYTFSIVVDIPDFDYDYSNYDMSAGYSDEIIEKKKATIEAFHNFFKIPVLEGERYQVGVNKDAEGNVIGYGVSGHNSGICVNDYNADVGIIVGDSFLFEMSSAYTEDTIYFTFSPMTFEGNVVDTSLIPGGYGIYSCKYDKENKLIDATTLKMEYELEPTGYVSLKLDAQEENLLMFTEEGQQFYMTVIDIETLEKKQTIMYGTAEAKDIARYWRVEEEYMIAQCDYYEACLLSRNEDGTYTKEITFPALIPAHSEENYFLSSDNAFAWNGEKLVIAGDITVEKPYLMSGCGLFVVAFDENGTLFYGEYDSSLNTGYVEEGYWICEPVDITIEWKD